MTDQKELDTAWTGYCNLPCQNPSECKASGKCRMSEAQKDSAAETSGSLNPPSGASAYASTESALKDSGERRQVSTGAVRDAVKGKGRFDLLPVHGLLLAALQMERGAAKYSARNWEKGMPLSWFANSAHRHLLKAVAGYDDEPHLDAAIWNLLCLAEGRKRIEAGLWPADLDDLPKTFAGLNPEF